MTSPWKDKGRGLRLRPDLMQEEPYARAGLRTPPPDTSRTNLLDSGATDSPQQSSFGSYIPQQLQSPAASYPRARAPPKLASPFNTVDAELARGERDTYAGPRHVASPYDQRVPTGSMYDNENSPYAPPILPRGVAVTSSQSQVYDPYLDGSPMFDEGRFISHNSGAPAFAETYWDENERDLYPQPAMSTVGVSEYGEMSPTVSMQNMSPSMPTSPHLAHPLQPTQYGHSRRFGSNGLTMTAPSKQGDMGVVHLLASPGMEGKEMKRNTADMGLPRENSFGSQYLPHSTDMPLEKVGDEAAGDAAGAVAGAVAATGAVPGAEGVAPTKAKKSKGKKGKAPADPNKPKPVTAGALFRYATPNEKLLNLLGIVCAAASGAAQPIMTILFGNLATAFLGMNENTTVEDFMNRIHQTERNINMDALYLVIIGICSWIVIYVYMAIWVYTGEVITMRIRENYLRAILRQDIAYFDNLGAGEITTRIQSDIQLIQDGISDKIPLMIALISTFITGFLVAYIRNWRLALVMTAILPCIVLTAIVMNIFVAKYQQIELDFVGKAASLAEETLSTVRTVKAFAMNEHLAAVYDGRNSLATAASRRRAIATGIGVGGFFFCVYSAYALAFFFGSKLVASGNIESGTVMNVIFSVLIGAFGMAMLAPNLQALSFAQAAGGKVYETIDRKSKIDSSSKEGLRPPQCYGNITVRNVNFTYPSRPDVPILKDFSLDIPAGRVTALVGPSGSGKSTIISLVERFYDPNEGAVFLDDVPIPDLNIQWLRTQIGLVSQEPTLFSTTVWENIAYGLIHTPFEHLSEEQKDKLIVEAARQANAHDFITQLPQGYHTQVGERAALLSGGQKQRVSIARAIVKNPRILLLDEATSALDTASEGIVQEALDRASRGRTTITIAHRLSTIKNADNIVVMKQGVIVEQGQHNELLQVPGGVYANLVAAQQINRDNTRAALTEYGDTFSPPPQFYEFGAKEDSSSNPMASRVSVLTNNDDSAASQVLRMSGLRHGKFDKDEKEKPLGMLYLMMRLARTGKDLLLPYFVPGMLCAILTGATYPSFAILFGLALTNYGKCQVASTQPGTPCPEPARSDMRSTANNQALYFFVIALISTVATVFQMALVQQGSAILMQRLRSRMFRAYMRADVSYFDEEGHSSGTLTSSLAENTQKINSFIGVSLGTIVQSISTLIVGAIIALIYGWKLSLVVIACIPFTLSAGFVRLRLVVMKDVQVRKAHLVSSQKACESANAIRTVASLTREDDCLREYHESLEGASQVAKKAALWGNIFYAFSQSTAFFVIALGFWYGSKLIFPRGNPSNPEPPEYSTGQFFTIFTAVVFGSIQAGNVFNFVPDISNARTAASAVFTLLDNKPKIDSESDDGIVLDHCQGHLRFEDVRFRYPSRPGVKVLRGVDIDAPPGTHCALVGGSGCGKSTTIQLIERFYDVESGRITLDGYDIRTINLRSLREHIALVSQEPTLYDGTIAFNLRLGALVPPEEVSDEQIRSAAAQANILEFIEGLPSGFDTQVGSKGTQLSGGQKQRIAIARALVRNPKILLLDEATSALDSDSEKIVQHALDSAARGRTTISIAHRLSTIAQADRIFAFQDGVVAEAGDHRALMAKKGIYANLVMLQALDPSA